MTGQLGATDEIDRNVRDTEGAERIELAGRAGGTGMAGGAYLLEVGAL